MDKTIIMLKAWDAILSPAQKRIIMFLSDRHGYFNGNFSDFAYALDDVRKNGMITGNSTIHLKKLEKMGLVKINSSADPYKKYKNRVPTSFTLVDGWNDLLLNKFQEL